MNMQKKDTIAETLFSNTYGGLSLILGDDGQKYLEMEDRYGPEYFGPLTNDQIAAFYVLREVRRAQRKSERMPPTEQE